MTALVSILNKRAAVIAADSAVTISNGDNRKIINTATKIFRLSSKNPVGVMIYSSAEFMGIPWDVLFKLYRDKNTGKSFDTLKEYVDDFINFLRHEKHCIDKDNQLKHLSYEARSFYDVITERVVSDYEKAVEKIDSEDVNKKKILLKCVNDNLKQFDNMCKERGVGAEFEDFSFQRFQTYAKVTLDQLENSCKQDEMPGVKSKWEKSFFNYIVSKLYIEWTGVVFVGYGNDEIYPTLIPLELAGFVDDKLRFLVNESRIKTISNDNRAFVSPFAQTDIMISLMKGIHPAMYTTVLNKVYDLLNAAKQQMTDSLTEAGMSETQTAKLKEVGFEDLTNKFKNEMKAYTQETFVDGIIDAVDSFNIEDMITMAESLISITNLQRHFTSSEESVGGPVDVAVITKSEGFIWVNHKQWFQQEMNPQMLERR